jgi:hypothetical protein
MARSDILNILYSKDKSPLEFQFDSLFLPSMYYFISPQDVQSLYNIASSVRYSSKIELKYKEIDKIMTNRGFKKFHSGTNRVVYSFLEDQSFVAKIAVDKVGLRDNPDEYRNQHLLKPFVTKVFETSPCGSIGLFERVQPITSRTEFLHVAEDVFELLNKFIIGKYVLEDIGTNYFMNWGLRNGFGLVLLDFPYCYPLDGNKLYCNKPDSITNIPCGGTIDYDAGFNNLKCTRCGKLYLAQELQEKIENKLLLIKGDEPDIKVRIKRGGQTIINYDPSRETDVIIRPKKNK